MNEFTFFIISAVILMIVILIIVYRKRLNKGINVVEVDLLTMEEIIKSFKRKEVMEILHNNDDFIAVVIKEYKEDHYDIVCTLYDRTEEAVVEDFKFPLMFKAKDINEDLKNAFSDKDMIVLK